MKFEVSDLLDEVWGVFQKNVLSKTRVFLKKYFQGKLLTSHPCQCQNGFWDIKYHLIVHVTKIHVTKDLMHFGMLFPPPKIFFVELPQGVLFTVRILPYPSKVNMGRYDFLKYYRKKFFVINNLTHPSHFGKRNPFVFSKSQILFVSLYISPIPFACSIHLV